MSRLVTRSHSRLVQLWRTDAPLTAVALLMLPVLLASVLGLWLDPRTLSGAPLWLKPAKFALSIALYSLTLVWIFGYLPAHVRTRRFVGRTTAVAMLIEIGVIGVQAARGVPSHFNVSTPLDSVLFMIMGLAIVLQTLSSVAVAVALWRQRFADRALGWALRLGMVITIVGASLGGAMTQPTSAQIGEIQAGHPRASGAHTVGALDGGPSVAVTGWSREHGDLRIPHFVGLHALQVLPLLGLALRRTRRSALQRVRLIAAAAASYVSLMAILLWQALRGQALIAPDTRTAVALIAWLGLSLTLNGLALRWGRSSVESPRGATLPSVANPATIAGAMLQTASASQVLEAACSSPQPLSQTSS